MDEEKDLDTRQSLSAKLCSYNPHAPLATVKEETIRQWVKTLPLYQQQQTLGDALALYTNSPRPPPDDWKPKVHTIAAILARTESETVAAPFLDTSLPVLNYIPLIPELPDRLAKIRPADHRRLVETRIMNKLSLPSWIRRDTPIDKKLLAQCKDPVMLAHYHDRLDLEWSPNMLHPDIDMYMAFDHLLKDDDEGRYHYIMDCLKRGKIPPDTLLPGKIPCADITLDYPAICHDARALEYYYKHVDVTPEQWLTCLGKNWFLEPVPDVNQFTARQAVLILGLLGNQHALSKKLIHHFGLHPDASPSLLGGY